MFIVRFIILQGYKNTLANKIWKGSAVSLTVAKIVPYKSESYNGVGLEPDHKVEMTAEQNARLFMLSKDEDAQYQKAMELLK